MSKTGMTHANNGLKKALRLGVGLSALLMGTQFSAMAQTEEDEGARRLNTVIVSATKREQTLQDVPVAVSVVDDGVIEKAEIQDLNDLQTLVPSLQVGQLQSSANTNFIIRGFGNGANNAGIEPSVGVFIDGVYRSRSAAQISDLPNLQRVEVLRGPQSTLFGKNASAGVISVITRAPQFETEANLAATIGNYGSYRVRGDITGPVSDKLAYSLSGNLNLREGYASDLNTGSEVNERQRWGVRGQLLFVPNDELEIRFIGDYDNIDEVCCVAGNLVNGPTGGAIFALGGQIDPENPFSYDVFNNFDSTNKIENQGLSMQADYDLGLATLTSITSYRTTSLRTNQDSDFTSADLVSRNFNDSDLSTFTQEVRLTSNGADNRFDWMIGGFFFDEKVELENEFFYGDDFRSYADLLSGGPAVLAGIEAFIGVPGGTLAGSGQGMTEEFGQDNTSWSVFGTLDFYATDRLTATFGVNYTDDQKDAYGRITNTDVLSGLDLTQLGYTAVLASLLGDLGVNIADPASIGPFIFANPQIYAALQAGAVGAAQNSAVNPFAALRPLQFLPPFLGFPNSVENGSTSDSNTSYTLRLAYDVTDNINVYGSYATGFKASSWNLSRDSRPFPTDYTPSSTIVDPVTQQVVFQATPSPITSAGLAVPNLVTGTRFAGPEEAEVFEIGLKGSFSQLAFNIALFDQTIEGFQSNVFTGTGFALANAGEQSTQGVEWDVTWNPIDALTLGFAGTFLDPVYDSFVNSSTGDISGSTPSGIPDLTTTVSFNYDFTVFDAMDSFVRADWQYVADTAFFDDGALENALIAATDFSREQNLVNASAGITLSNGVGMSVWARNLLDDEYISTAFPSVAQGGSVSGYPNQPRTYGVTVRMTF